MRTNIFLKIFVAILVVLALGAFYLKFTKKSLPPVFQPDSQISNQSGTLPDNPITAKEGGVAYTYDTKVCQNTTSQYGCMVDFYKKLVSDYGVVVATADMEKRSKEDSSVLAECHPLMHVVGRQAASSYKTIAEAFAHGDSFCWSGYYHGLMEGMIIKIGKGNLAKELNNICADIPGKEKYDFNYFNCVHGLGHGIMALLEDEVFDSLKMCDNLTGSWEEQSCYGGVFMQNIIDSTNVADTDNVVKYLKPEDPLYPCGAVDEKYKGQCYLGQTSYALQVTSYNYQKVFGLCTTLPQPYRDICNQSMGRDVANQVNHDALRTRDMCIITKNQNDQDNCIIGAVKEIISYYHSDKEALAFCNILGEGSKTICTNTANAYYKQF